MGGLEPTEEAELKEHQRGCLQSQPFDHSSEAHSSENPVTAEKAAQETSATQPHQTPGPNWQSLWNLQQQKSEAHVWPQLPLPPRGSLCLRGSKTQEKSPPSKWRQCIWQKQGSDVRSKNEGMEPHLLQRQWRLESATPKYIQRHLR